MTFICLNPRRSSPLHIRVDHIVITIWYSRLSQHCGRLVAYTVPVGVPRSCADGRQRGAPARGPMRWTAAHLIFAVLLCLGLFNTRGINYYIPRRLSTKLHDRQTLRGRKRAQAQEFTVDLGDVTFGLEVSLKLLFSKFIHKFSMPVASNLDIFH